MASPYAQSGGSGGSVYAKTSSGGGSPYAGGGGAAKAKAKPKGGGGLFGAISGAGHWVGQKADLAARDIKGMAGGAYSLAKLSATADYYDATGQHQKASGLQKKINVILDQQVGAPITAPVEAAKHPLRDPFLTATAVVAPLLHGGLRGAEVARGVDTAAARTLKVGDAQVPLIRSRSATGRAAQGVYDKVLQRGLDKKPEGRVAAHAQKRVGGALKEEANIAQRMRTAPAQMLDRSAAKLAKTPAARREQQAALELTSVNTSPEAAAAYHFKQAADGVNPKQNLQVGRLYKRVAQKGYLTKDEHGNVAVDAVAHPKLAAVDAALGHVQTKGDEILVDKGVRDAGALAARRDAPGRIRAGASYEKPTPAKRGVSPALVKATTERDRLAALHAKALDAEAKWSKETKAGSQTVDLRTPLTADEAHARMAELDQRYNDFLDKAVPEVSPYGGKVSQREQLRRNFENGKVGRGKRAGAKRQETVKAEERQLAEERLHEIIAKNPEHPAAKMAQQFITERQQLRDALNQRGEASIEGKVPPPLPRTGKPAEVPAASNPYRNRIVSLGNALEVAQAKVDRIGAAAEKRVKPTGIVGGETARPGRGFVSERVSDKKLSKAEASASRGPVVGAAKSPIDSKSYTGRALEQGFRPKHVTASASRHFRQIIRFVNTDAIRRQALQTGSDVRRSNRDVLVRNPDVTAEKLGAHIQQALGSETTAVDTADELATQEGLHAAHQAYLDHVIPGLRDRFATDRQHAVGVKAPDGYRWVDRGALGDLTAAPFGPRGRIARTTDTINSAITAATVYFKVGHIGTRVFTNAATNIIQGSAAPRQIGRSAKLWETLSPEERVRALAASGQHGSFALPHEGTNLIAAVAGKGAQWWAKHADAMFRFNSLAYEMRRAGYDTPEKFKAALDHLESGGQGLPAHEWAKVSAAARRADREAISYDRLNDFERRFLTRAIWFYPWIKGSTLFTVRTAIEHPYKTAALGVLGQQGRKTQEATLGQTPSYEAGLFGLGGGGPNPMVTDFSTFSPFATSADVADAPGHPGSLAGFLNPAAGAAGQFIYGLNQYGGASTSPYKDALLSLASATPEQQLAEAYQARNQDQSTHMFHKTVPSTLLRFLVGPAMPRRVNVAALNKSAAREKAGGR